MVVKTSRTGRQLKKGEMKGKVSGKIVRFRFLNREYRLAI